MHQAAYHWARRVLSQSQVMLSQEQLQEVLNGSFDQRKHRGTAARCLYQ